jgi:hypothetical protein
MDSATLALPSQHRSDVGFANARPSIYAIYLTTADQRRSEPRMLSSSAAAARQTVTNDGFMQICKHIHSQTNRSQASWVACIPYPGGGSINLIGRALAGLFRSWLVTNVRSAARYNINRLLMRTVAAICWCAIVASNTHPLAFICWLAHDTLAKPPATHINPAAVLAPRSPLPGTVRSVHAPMCTHG